MGALLLPALARNHDRRPLLLLALMMQLIGFIGLIYLPQTLPWLWVLLSGLGLGGAFPLCPCWRSITCTSRRRPGDWWPLCRASASCWRG